MVEKIMKKNVEKRKKKFRLSVCLSGCLAVRT